jgi:hypothetical protein
MNSRANAASYKRVYAIEISFVQLGKVGWFGLRNVDPDAVIIFTFNSFH